MFGAAPTQPATTGRAPTPLAPTYRPARQHHPTRVAARAREARPTVPVRIRPIPKVAAPRRRWRHTPGTRPLQDTALHALESRGRHTANGVNITGHVSAQRVSRNVGPLWVGQPNLDRWAAIEAGSLPEGDDVIPPLDVWRRQVESQQLEPLYEAARAKEQRIQEAMETDLAMLEREAVRLDEEASAQDAIAAFAPHPAIKEEAKAEARRLRYRSTMARTEMGEVGRRAQAAVDEVADQLRMDRNRIRDRAVQQREDDIHERVAQLRAGLANEIASEVQKRYLPEFEVDDYELY